MVDTKNKAARPGTVEAAKEEHHYPANSRPHRGICEATETAFLAFMHEKGIPPATSWPVADLQPRRFRIAGDEPGRLDGFYRLNWTDPVAHGAVGHRLTGELHFWLDPNAGHLNARERRQIQNDNWRTTRRFLKWVKEGARK